MTAANNAFLSVISPAHRHSRQATTGASGPPACRCFFGKQCARTHFLLAAVRPLSIYFFQEVLLWHSIRLRHKRFCAGDRPHQLPYAGGRTGHLLHLYYGRCIGQGNLSALYPRPITVFRRTTTPAAGNGAFRPMCCPRNTPAATWGISAFPAWWCATKPAPPERILSMYPTASRKENMP